MYFTVTNRRRPRLRL